MTHISFGVNSTYPRVLYYEVDPGIAVRITFDDDGEVIELLYNSFGIVYRLTNMRTDQFRGKLYSNNDVNEVTRKDALLFKCVERLTSADVLMMKLKYNIDTSMVTFSKSADLTSESKQNIHKQVVLAGIDAIQHDPKVGDKTYRFIWSLKSDEHINTAKANL